MLGKIKSIVDGFESSLIGKLEEVNGTLKEILSLIKEIEKERKQ